MTGLCDHNLPKVHIFSFISDFIRNVIWTGGVEKGSQLWKDFHSSAESLSLIIIAV